MVSLGSVAMGVLALALLAVGYVFVFRVETALAFQRRYAEAVSSVPPSENSGYYEETREHWRGVFRVGGAVLLAVGALVFAMWMYGVLFVASFP